MSLDPPRWAEAMHALVGMPVDELTDWAEEPPSFDLLRSGYVLCDREYEFYTPWSHRPYTESPQTAWERLLAVGILPDALSACDARRFYAGKCPDCDGEDTRGKCHRCNGSRYLSAPYPRCLRHVVLFASDPRGMLAAEGVMRDEERRYGLNFDPDARRMGHVGHERPVRFLWYVLSPRKLRDETAGPRIPNFPGANVLTDFGYGWRGTHDDEISLARSSEP